MIFTFYYPSSLQVPIRSSLLSATYTYLGPDLQFDEDDHRNILSSVRHPLSVDVTATTIKKISFISGMIVKYNFNQGFSGAKIILRIGNDLKTIAGEGVNQLH